MGYLGRRVGKSQNNSSSGDGVDGNLGGGILDLFAQGYFAREGNINRSPGSPSSGLTATGGIISDYTDGSKIYRAHIFTSSGTLNITAGGDFDGDGVEYLVVGGGGGGGGGSPPSDVGGGGGGAGGLRTNLSGHPLTGGSYPIPGSFPAPYVVTVGGGGFGRGSGANLAAGDGTSSEFYPPSHSSYPAAQFIRGAGGGGGASRDPGNSTEQRGRSGLAGGGSGGGSWDPTNPYPGAVGSPDPNHPETAGHAGGGGYPGGAVGTGPTEGNGGGGGAGGSGNPGDRPGSGGGAGGAGIRVSIGGPSSDPSPIGDAGPGSGAAATGWFAGGGGGGASNTSGDGGGGGGGHPTAQNSYAGGGWGGNAPPSPINFGSAGISATGGGGGGGGRRANGRNGGSGIVVIRYQVGIIQSTGSSPKGASGGAVTLYNNKVIHTFTSSGSFEAPGSFSETLEYVIIGGGGAGGGQNFRGGGGGAGSVRHGTTPIDNTGPGNPSTTTVQVGAGGMYFAPEGPSGNGTSSYFGTPITSPGGGMGSGYEIPYAGIPGGSGGGAGGYPSDDSGGTSSGDPFPGNPADTSPANGWGYDGGDTTPGGNQQGGGGGGAGGLGIPQSKSASPTTYGFGGPGIQLPATFRDPRSAPGGTGGTGPHNPNAGGGLGYQNPGGTGWYVAGGGNGGGYSKPSGVNPSVITFVPAGGGGRGAINGPGNSPEPEHPYRNNGWPGAVNSGSGGGGASPYYEQVPGQGGSGLVLIAYPT